MDGVDRGLGKSVGLRVDDGLVDLEAAKHGAEGGAIARGQLRRSERKVREIHEPGARIWRTLAEGAFKLQRLAAYRATGEEGAAGAAILADRLDLLDDDRRDGGSTEAAGLLIQFGEGAAEIGSVGSIEAARVDGVAARGGHPRALRLLCLGTAWIMSSVWETQGEHFAVGPLGEDRASATLGSDLPPGRQHDHRGAILRDGTDGGARPAGAFGFRISSGRVSVRSLQGFAARVPVVEEGLQHRIHGGAEARGVVGEERSLDMSRCA